jgi:aconitate hydratase
MAEYDKALNPATFNKEYNGIEQSNEKWNAIPVPEGALYKWDEWSTYIQEPPFFVDMGHDTEPISRLPGPGYWSKWPTR